MFDRDGYNLKKNLVLFILYTDAVFLEFKKLCHHFLLHNVVQPSMCLFFFEQHHTAVDKNFILRQPRGRSLQENWTTRSQFFSEPHVFVIIQKWWMVTLLLTFLFLACQTEL